jgi:hypothetical protein
MSKDTPDAIEKLRQEILEEFQTVYKLAPSDYTENCTNVVMSIFERYITEREQEARGCVDCKTLRCENCERLWQS